MTSYKAAYASLNAAQKRAVDQVDGPVLVIAGPGTGKTQLLSTRAAHIAALGTANANNILCLTYTEAGASEMRLRLSRIMGTTGSDVAVHTFHSFGSLLINQYPEKFSAIKSLKALDDLGRYRLFEDLLSQLPLRHALAVRDADGRFVRQGNVVETIRVFKQAGMSPADVRSVLAANQLDYDTLQPLFDELFGSTLSAKRLPAIVETTLNYQAKFEPGSYGALLLLGLSQAIDDSAELGKTAPLGAWRTKHMQIVGGKKVLKSAARQAALLDVVTLYEQYQTELETNGHFDYEDMVLWAADVLRDDEDLRLEIAERFQYIMVDEYQDTNGAQNRLLDTILSANPIDSPNILVVGDDDQAIMRFQGAELSGLLAFVDRYQPTTITLTENYRSGQRILDASRQIIVQTDERLESALPDMQLDKTLQARNEPAQTVIEHYLYATESAQYQAITDYIAQLIADGIAATNIAVIGRKHKELVNFSQYLAAQSIAANYDRRENVLTDSRIEELLTLAHYVSLLHENPKRADQLLPLVLSGSYWQISSIDLYQLAAKAKLVKLSWLDTMLGHEDEAWRQRATWLIAAGQAIVRANFTTGLDILLGRTALPEHGLIEAPYASYMKLHTPEQYIGLLSHIIKLREAVLAAQPSASSINDLLNTVADYRHSQIQLVDDNPLLRGDQAGITLLSAHGAKGREFEHVIVLSVVDTVWGNRARGHNQRIHLPENLPLYPAGDTESDRLRLLYVAMTRAKSHLLLASYEKTEEGKAVVPLTYLQIGEQNMSWSEPAVHSLQTEQTVQALETTWLLHSTIERDLGSTIAPLLPHYRLSATALRNFLDICYAGPLVCIERSVLGFPSAYTASSALGKATHAVLQQAQQAYANDQSLDDAALLTLFDQSLNASGLPSSELDAVRTHGHQFLPQFVQSFSASDFGRITATEQSLSAVLPNGNVPFSGAIDALIENGQQVEVIDYKTGKPPLPNWETRGLSEGKKVSLHFYRQQLLCYKLLVENSKQYAGKHVTLADLVFVEPSETEDSFVRLNITDFDQAELDRTARLIAAVYQRICNGDLPDISPYSKDLRGIRQFEEDLLQ
jgi:DNA helicase-2/ATP-dependent DNA helicase PcrA